MTELRRRMIQDMKLRGLAESTQQSYVRVIRDLAKHYSRQPDQITEEEVRRFLLYLTEIRRLAKSTIRVYLFAIKFFYRMTLQRQWPVLQLARIKKKTKLPVVLSVHEVWQLLNRVRRPAARMSLILMYSCGLRVSEAIHLRASDIDSQRMVVHVRNGKGDKQRQVPLPTATLKLLRAYWREHRPDRWLFPAANGLGPIRRDAVLKCLTAALSQTNIPKRVSCHTLRHSYATHLLERHIDLRIIQGLLGHKSLRSTIVYLHMTQGTMKSVHRALDDLMSHC